MGITVVTVLVTHTNSSDCELLEDECDVVLEEELFVVDELVELEVDDFDVDELDIDDFDVEELLVLVVEANTMTSPSIPGWYRHLYW